MQSHSINKGPSIKDVFPEGEGGGFQKWNFGEIFKAYLGRQGEGGGSKIMKNEKASFMDGP